MKLEGGTLDRRFPTFDEKDTQKIAIGTAKSIQKARKQGRELNSVRSRPASNSGAEAM